MRIVRLSLVVVVLLGAFAASASAKKYNAVKEFSTTSGNPHGVWSYLTAGKLDTTVANEACGIKESGWTNGLAVPNDGNVIGNKSGKAEKCTSNGTVTVPAKTLNVDPESNANEAVQWTAPAAANYTVVGNFRGDDSFELTHKVEVQHNGVSSYSNTINTFEQVDAFSLTVTVNAGDTISFVVDTNEFHNLSTGLQVTIKKGKKSKT